MSSLNNYYSEVRSDIAKDFGLESAGFAPAPTYYITIREAQRISEKYPSTWVNGRPVLNPKAVKLIKRIKAIRIANDWKGAN